MRRFLVICASYLVIIGAYNASAQKFPTKSVRIVTAEVGGGSDFAARLLGQGLAASLGQPVIIENRASATIGALTVAKASPDGHTLLFHANPIWILPLLQDDVPYDPVRDFAPISLVDISPLVLVVHPSLAVKSVKELVALVKTKPGAFNYASGLSGSTPHLAAELFKSMAGVNIAGVSYKGTGPALNDVMSGRVQMMFTTTAAGMPHVKSGRLTALAVTSAQQSALVPGLPTVAASGVPGYESGTVHGLFAPAKTPVAIINRLNQDTTRYLALPEVKDRFLAAGVEPVGTSPQVFAAAIKSDIVLWGKLIKEAGIRAN